MIGQYAPDGLSVRRPPLIRSEGNRFYADISDRSPVSAAARLLQGEKRYPAARNIQVVLYRCESYRVVLFLIEFYEIRLRLITTKDTEFKKRAYRHSLQLFLRALRDLRGLIGISLIRFSADPDQTLILSYLKCNSNSRLICKICPWSAKL